MADNEPDPNKPKSVSVDGQAVSQHSLKEQMDARDRQTAKAAAKRQNFGLRRTRMQPGDAV